MKKRIITASVLFMVLGPLLILSAFYEAPKTIMEILLMAIAVGAELELLNMYDKTKPIGWKMKVICILLTLLLYFCMVNWFYDRYKMKFNESAPLIYLLIQNIHATSFMTPFVAILAIFIFLMAIMVLKSNYTVADIGRLFISIMYVGICVGAFSILFLLRLRFVIYLLGITVFTDIFALVFGMCFGKHKMAPVTSPKKTWEGAIGGTATAVVVGTLIIVLYPYYSEIFHSKSQEFFNNVIDEPFSIGGKIVVAFILSLFLSVCSQIGDLLASKLKRAYGIKDYSNIFPGHGGILDRFDSAFFASAIFLLVLLIIMYLFTIV